VHPCTTGPDGGQQARGDAAGAMPRGGGARRHNRVDSLIGVS